VKQQYFHRRIHLLKAARRASVTGIVLLALSSFVTPTIGADRGGIDPSQDGIPLAGESNWEPSDADRIPETVVKFEDETNPEYLVQAQGGETRASGTFTNAGFITIPAGAPGTTSGNAAPYPSTIFVSGLGGSITDVNVMFDEIGHTHPDDLDIIVVSPSGDSTILMSDACGSTDFDDFDWTFDDEASTLMPDSPAGACVEFFYKPSSYDGASDTWPAAFPGSHGTTLSRFDGENANGTWSLYVRDDAGSDVGDIELGWSITITTGPFVALIPGSGTSGNASPYPYTVNLQTPLGVITDVNVMFDGLTHSHPDDLDIAVVSPDGAATILMSDACGSFDIASYIWRWDDEAAALMTDNGSTNVCSPFNNRPTNYGIGDSWLAPGPGAITTASLATFDGEAAIGQWKFYIVDDAGSDAGFLINPPVIEASVAAPLIEIPNAPNTSGVADPYPAIKNVAGLVGVITDVNVTINEFYHLYPDDVDMLLVSPTGVKVMLMSDACGGNDTFDYQWTFDDEAPSTMTDDVIAGCDPFSIRPSNFESNETMPGPAPAGPYHARMSAFDGMNPNGNWQLYIQDDASGDTGFITPSWDLTITTQNDVNLIQNGSFGSGMTNWLTFTEPNASLMVHQVTGGVFQFYRAASSTSGVVFQNTGAALPANRTYDLAVELGNTSAARKRVAILVHDGDFSDLRVCSFWLQPNTPLTLFKMVGKTREAWTNATVSIYSSSADGLPWTQVDNVRLIARDDLTDVNETLCMDPFAPAMVGVANGANLVTNGTFAGGSASWFTFGQIITNGAAGGVMEFYRPSGTPAGVVAQNTAGAAAAGNSLEATFQLGNSSASTMRVTVLLHANDFSDLQACTFWLPPGAALANYRIITYTTKAWPSASISFYPSTVVSGAPTGNIRLDNVDVHLAEAVKAIGTGCYEPGSILPAGGEDLPAALQPTLEPTATMFAPFVPDGAPMEIAPLATAAPSGSEASPGEGSISEGG